MKTNTHGEAFNDLLSESAHLRIVWVEIESTAVEVDGCFESLAIAIASKIAV
jgi:hypothetical protein